MKQKCDKTIVIKFFVVLFAIFFSFFANGFAQYYYFSNGGRTYQQGCSELLEVRVNSLGQNVRAGRFHLVLDSGTTIYPQTNAVSELRSFFSASTDTFLQWTSEGSPSWKGSDYTILQADRNNGTTDYNGSNKLYANVNFKPVFSGGVYDIVFGMEYISGDTTTETTLSLAGGKELINPEQQELYRTGTYQVLQEPCVADTKKPTVENISIKNNSTKVSYLSGLSFSLKDAGGSNGVSNVPYIWSGGEWTGNVGGTITNQYGISGSTLVVTLNGNGHTLEQRFINSEGVSGTWNGRTWQDESLNLDVSISSGGLFDFGIEKQISISFVVYDRAGNKNNPIVITFNTPKGPELISDSVYYPMSPKDNDIYVNLTAPIKLGIKDDWAGVKSGTIAITLSGVDGTEYGPYTFSGADLNLSGVWGEANEPDYYINISNHEKFPTSGTIRVSVYAEDMEGKVDEISDYTFTTRPDCTDFQCCDPVLLDLGNEGDTYYYNTGLIISGGNNPTIFVDAENNTGIIDCNTEEEGLSIYEGETFKFFVDESTLTILGTGVKGVLSGNVLTLSYIVEDAQVVIDKPSDMESLSGGEVDIQWHLTGVENQDDWLSGYVIQIYSGEDLITGGFVDGTGIIENLTDGEYVIVIYPVDLGGHTGNQVELDFVVDMVAPICNIEILTQECTNSGVEIRLSGDMSDVINYGWWNGTTGDFGNNITTIVNQNGEYTGYVYDGAGNQGICTGMVGLDKLDQDPITYEVHSISGYECETITGYVQISTGDTCGKHDFSEFGYLWDGGFITAEHGILVNNVSGFDVNITISDGAGNTVLDSVHYTWQDTGVALLSGNVQTISLVTGNYDIAKIDLINLFGAEEGSCGTSQVTVTGQNCSGATISIDGGIITIIPDSNLDSVDGYCEFKFSDDEGEKIAIGTLEFVVDTVAPGIILEGTNIACMSTNIFNVTGIFTESVQGFQNSDIDIENGSISNFSGEGAEYTWEVIMNPMAEVKLYVPEGTIVDLNGIENTVSNILTGMYDNVGPKDVLFTNWQDTVFTTDVTLNWNGVTDSGCAGLSGYNYKFVQGISCGIDENVLFTVDTSVDVNGLVDGNTYTLCVQPVDMFGNVGSWTSGSFNVDLNAIGCVFEESACSNTGVLLTLKPSNTEWTGIYLSWTGEGYWEDVSNLVQNIKEAGKIITGYIYQSGIIPKQSMCIYEVENIDQTEPIITNIVNDQVFECTTGIVNIVATDEGCGDSLLTYMWDGGEFVADNTYSLRTGSAGDKTIDFQIMDNVGNVTSGTTSIVWQNSWIEWENFTGSNDVGNTGKTVNWREKSRVVDGACGSGTIDFVRFISAGDKGECTISGDNLTYTPYENFTGMDICVIRVADDEGSTGDIVVTFSGIDTEKPSCNLEVQGGEDCTGGIVFLSLNSESNDVVEYKIDGEIWNAWSSNVLKGINVTGIYIGYVKDYAGNISEPCEVRVTGGILDLDVPSLDVYNWTGYECSTGSITVVGNDNSCGINGLYYQWEGFENTGAANEIYSGNVGSQAVNVSVFDGVGHSITKQVIYTRQNEQVTGSGFTVENSGTGIIVDRFVNGSISAGSCELDDVVAISNNTGMCEISGHNIIYKPSEGLQGGENCIITVTDGDMEGGDDIELQITFTGVDTKKPTVELQGGVGEQCTSGNTFTVTGTFSEEVLGVTIDTLTGENVEIKSIEDVDGNIYKWIVELEGGTGKVWVDSGVLFDLLGNENEGSNVLVLGNYDNTNPQYVSLLSPGSGTDFSNRTIDFEWISSSDEGCAGLSGYVLNICQDANCNNVIESVFTGGTGITITLQDNGNYYWTVVPIDVNGNTGTGGTGYFDVESIAPTCSITQSECSNSPVHLLLTGSKEISVLSGNIVWQQVSQDTYSAEISENIDIWAIVKDLDNQTGYCHLQVTNFDNVGPDFEFGIIEVDEGTSLNINIVANDTGCAGISGYIFGTDFGLGVWQTGSQLQLTAEQIGNTGGIQKEQVVTVVDNFGNIIIKTGTIIISDVKPTFLYSTGILSGVYTGDFSVDVIDLLGATEGGCGTGDLEVEIVSCLYATGYVSGHVLYVNVDENAAGLGSCFVRVKDNEGSYSDVDGAIEFEVKTKKPECSGLIYEPDFWTSGNSVTVYLTGCGEPISGTLYHEFTGNSGYTFEFVDLYGNTGSFFVQYTGFDDESPVFDFISNSGYECQTGSLTISNAVDSGIGLADFPYSFDGINRSTGNVKDLYFAGSTGIFVSGYVRDGLGNQNEIQAEYVFNNSIPTAIGFTVGVLKGVDVNWKDLSDATDGACGSGVLSASVTGGSIGHCLLSGDILSYIPNDTNVTGADSCELTIYDDEGYSIVINVEFTDINEYPYIELVQPENGKIINNGNITLSCTGVGNGDLISGYVYRLWNATDEWIMEVTGSSVTIDLRNGSYNWDVYAEFIDGTTGGLSDTYSFNVTITVPSGGGGGGGGGGHSLTKDACPNGDFSDSHYDGICGMSGQSHGIASTDICGVNNSNYSTEMKLAYLYSYMHGITTMCPIQNANLDGYLIRSHFAKMISEFAVNVVGLKPNKGKPGCDKFDDIKGLDDELKSFVTTACELGLMGLDADGVTASKSFNPDGYVSRAQFGTVLSRLLFGDMFNVKNEGDGNNQEGYWYKNHLLALNTYGIMTKIDGDWPNYLERRGRVMLMLQRADNYGVFAGKIPAKNGVKALFDD